MKQEKKQSPGYQLRTIPIAGPFGQRHDNIELLLPNNFDVNAYVARSFSLRYAREEPEPRAVDVIEEPTKVAGKPSATELEQEHLWPVVPNAAIEAELLLNRGSTLARKQKRLIKSSRLAAVYPPDEPAKLVNRYINTNERGGKDRFKHWYMDFVKAGHLRTLLHPKATRSKSEIAQLRLEHPHFADVISLVEQSLGAAIVQKKPLQLPPILLVGAPGVGKTHFARALANALALPVERINFDSGVMGSQLIGLDRHWSNSTPGLLFELLCLGQVLNPVVLLDEIDKAYTPQNDIKALAPLHTLLEPISSKNMTDVSVGMSFDASWVSWIATANNVRHIPSTLMSRFRVFEIELPDAEQAIDLAGSVARTIHAQFGAVVPRAPHRSVVLEIAALTPRQMRLALEAGYAAAIASRSEQLRVSHLPRAIMDDLLPASEARSRTLH